MPDKPDALDYSWGRPSIAALKDAGIKLVSRYLSHDSGKNLSAAEAEALHRAGIGILLNWESIAGRPLGGAATGTDDGHDAAALCEQIGAPHGLTIYYSCDTDTMPSQWPIIAEYYRAAGQATHGRYKVGVYGEADLIDFLHRRGVVTSEWQTYAWSNGRLSANADLYQYLNSQTLGGAAVDFDRIIHPEDLGAWWPEGSEHIMPTAEEIAAAVARHEIIPPGEQYPKGVTFAGAQRKILALVSNPKLLADAIAAQLPADTADGTLTRADVRAATEAAVRDVLGTLDGD